MIKYKIEGNNAEEFRKLAGNFERREIKETLKDNNERCPICGGDTFDPMPITNTHISYQGKEYSYTGKGCISCNYIKPIKF